mmetsp:Transcript_61204/g.96882  ORF Transcript_61204/g.96882 Transcript_61204/m.96882 type:complete len:94 (+) Transcript_61204:232-513(+)
MTSSGSAKTSATRTHPLKSLHPSSCSLTLTTLGALARRPKILDAYAPGRAFLHIMTSLGDRFEAEEVAAMMADLKSEEDVVSYKDFITWALER